MTIICVHLTEKTKNNSTINNKYTPYKNNPALYHKTDGNLCKSYLLDPTASCAEERGYRKTSSISRTKS